MTVSETKGLITFLV